MSQAEGLRGLGRRVYHGVSGIPHGRCPAYLYGRCPAYPRARESGIPQGLGSPAYPGCQGGRGIPRREEGVPPPYTVPGLPGNHQQHCLGCRPGRVGGPGTVHRQHRRHRGSHCHRPCAIPAVLTGLPKGLLPFYGSGNKRCPSSFIYFIPESESTLP